MSPRRTCIGCRAPLTPDEGVRVTRAADGVLVTGRSAPGRGAWLCRATAASCGRAASKRRAWTRALRAEVPPAVIDDLLSALERPGPSVGADAAER